MGKEFSLNIEPYSAVYYYYPKGKIIHKFSSEALVALLDTINIFGGSK